MVVFQPWIWHQFSPSTQGTSKKDVESFHDFLCYIPTWKSFAKKGKSDVAENWLSCFNRLSALEKIFQKLDTQNLIWF